MYKDREMEHTKRYGKLIEKDLTDLIDEIRKDLTKLEMGTIKFEINNEYLRGACTRLKRGRNEIRLALLYLEG